MAPPLIAPDSRHRQARYIGPMTDLNAPREAVTPRELDYWSFVDLARQRLDEEFSDNDATATKVILTLNRASSSVTYDLESSVHRPRGWSWSAFRMMFVLWLAGPMEPNIAAKLTGMSRAAVSNLSNTLVVKELLSKEPSGSDGRAVTLSLTAKGVAEIREAFLDHNRRESSWASVLTHAEQELLVMLLEKLMSKREGADHRARR